MEISFYSSQKHKDQQNNWQEMLEGVRGKGNPLSLSVELKSDTDSIDIKARNSQKAENKSIIWLVYTTPYHILKGFNIIHNRFLLIHVDFYSIYNGQEMKTTQTSYKQQMHYENVVDIHYGMLSICKEKNINFAEKWMELEKITLHEGTQKAKIKSSAIRGSYSLIFKCEHISCGVAIES